MLKYFFFNSFDFATVHIKLTKAGFISYVPSIFSSLCALFWTVLTAIKFLFEHQTHLLRISKNRCLFTNIIREAGFFGQKFCYGKFNQSCFPRYIQKFSGYLKKKMVKKAFGMNLGFLNKYNRNTKWVFGFWVALRITQPFILPRSIKWVPETPGDWMAKSKLSPRSGSVALR